MVTSTLDEIMLIKPSSTRCGTKYSRMVQVWTFFKKVSLADHITSNFLKAIFGEFYLAHS